MALIIHSLRWHTTEGGKGEAFQSECPSVIGRLEMSLHGSENHLPTLTVQELAPKIRGGQGGSACADATGAVGREEGRQGARGPGNAGRPSVPDPLSRLTSAFQDDGEPPSRPDEKHNAKDSLYKSSTQK